MPLKNAVYAVAKNTGLFAGARLWTHGALRILCYHGFSFSDEHLFRPQLFQTPEVFRQRMRYLQRKRYRTLSLGDAVRRLREGTLTANDLVITIDDGFFGVHALGAPILSEFGFSATIYVTTYYMQRNHPIFRLAMQYLFWKTSLDTFDCAGLPVASEARCPTRGVQGEKALWDLINHGETKLDEPGRLALARDVAQRLDVDYDELTRSRRLTLMNDAEVADLANRGFDIQLHTHRHCLPADAARAKREIVDNRAALASLAKPPLTHLCYPSGVWSPQVWPHLVEQGVETATTCDPGLNYRDTPLLGLKRFLDSQVIPQVVFEGSVCGFTQILRRLAGRASHAPAVHAD